jgi:amino acid transporter
MEEKDDRSTHYDEGSLSLSGTVMLGTGVMIGAGIFALTGQMAEMTGALFPLAFLAAAIIVGFSAYSYIKISSAYPSAGGICIRPMATGCPLRLMHYLCIFRWSSRRVF